MKHGIFYNSKKSKCSIYESGVMCFNALKASDLYTLDYTETDVLTDCDFIVVNYHPVTNAWMTKNIVKAFGKKVFCIVTEVALQGNPIQCVPDYFTDYIVLDPTIVETQTIHGFGRPLYSMNVIQKDNDIPTFGMFGFATNGKHWTTLIQAVNDEFDRAVIRFNIPHATYVPDSMWQSTVDEIKRVSQTVKPTIEVIITDTYYSDSELVQWCADNTLNCFFYHRDHMFVSGLAAVTDQAIVARKPILVTKDKTFRHLHKYITPYPDISLRKAIETNREGVLRMYEDWSSAIFRSKFESIL